MELYNLDIIVVNILIGMSKEYLLNFIANNYPFVIGIVGLLCYGVWAGGSAVDEAAMQKQLAKLQSVSSISTVAEIAESEFVKPNPYDAIKYYGVSGALLGCGEESAWETGKTMIDLGLRSMPPVDYLFLDENGMVIEKELGISTFLTPEVLSMVYGQNITSTWVYVSR